jgi:hypothetical protein
VSVTTAATAKCCSEHEGARSGCACTFTAITTGSCEPLKRLNERTWAYSDCYWRESKKSPDMFYCSSAWRECCRKVGGLGPVLASAGKRGRAQRGARGISSNQ